VKCRTYLCMYDACRSDSVKNGFVFRRFYNVLIPDFTGLADKNTAYSKRDWNELLFMKTVGASARDNA